jgi:hypothetical protein
MREYFGERVLKDSSCGIVGSPQAPGSYIFFLHTEKKNKKETFFLLCCTPVSEVHVRGMPASPVPEPP